MADTGAAGPKKGKSGALIVNLDELAGICGITPETMRAHLANAPADADWMVQRGRRGVGYKLQAEGAVAWWRNRSAETDNEADLRNRQLAELRMQMLGGDAGVEDLLLPGKQRQAEFDAGRAELAYREAMGELCRATDIDAELVNAAIELRRTLQAVGRTIRRKFGLDREVETAIDELIGQRLQEFVDNLDAADDTTGAPGTDAGPSPAGKPDPADAADPNATPVRKRPRHRAERDQGAAVPGETDALGGGEPAPQAPKPRRVQRMVEG